MINLLLSLIIITHSPESAERCQSCHSEIYKNWRNSAHSRSTTNPAFLSALKEIMFRGKKNDVKFCLSCHTPITLFNKDINLKEKITLEGVTCDFCHSIRGLTEREQKIIPVLEPGWFKYGPQKKFSPAHGIRASRIFKESSLCEMCHELYSKKNIKIITTFSEWKSSGDKRACQGCHRHGRNIFLISEKGKSSDHSVFTLKLEKTLENSEEKIYLHIKNNLPHSYPTGFPDKALRVDIKVTQQNRVILKKRLEYFKVFADENNMVIPADSPAEKFITSAKMVVEDTRFSPFEEKRELVGKFEHSLTDVIFEVKSYITYGGGKTKPIGFTKFNF